MRLAPLASTVQARLRSNAAVISALLSGGRACCGRCLYCKWTGQRRANVAPRCCVQTPCVVMMLSAPWLSLRRRRHLISLTWQMGRRE